MIERVIRDSSYRITRGTNGFTLTAEVRFCESSLAGGSIRTHTDRYEHLSRDELAEVLEVLADSNLPGDEFRGAGLQLSLI